MQVTETLSEGLKRELKVTIPAADLEDRLLNKLTEIKDRVQIKGFRPGKVPIDHLRKVYGRSVMAEVIEQAVTESSQKAVADREENPAFQPDIQLPEDKDEVEGILSGTNDLAFTMAFELLPAFEITDLSKLELERQTAEIDETEVDEALARLADQNKPFDDKDGQAETGDRVVIDFVGSIDGEEFEGGAATDAPLELGSGQFIPGFEDQLVGAKAGDAMEITVTFPDDYGADHLAGKEAVFKVTVKSVLAPGAVTLDDEFAKTLGLETLDAVKDAIRSQIQGEYDVASRTKVKRILLDKLDDAHPIDLPGTLVDREFDGIWAEVQNDMERNEKTFEDEDTTEEKAREEYRGIAERRVRLGLVLAKIGEKAEIEISDEEMHRAVMARARQFAGQEQQVFDYYTKNPQALMELRAPLYEEKVVDYILELATVTDKPVSKDELLKVEDDDEETDG